MMAFTRGINCFINCYTVLIQMFHTPCLCVFHGTCGDDGDSYVYLTRLFPRVSTLRRTCPLCLHILLNTQVLSKYLRVTSWKIQRVHIYIIQNESPF
jgi:hypothetical protein